MYTQSPATGPIHQGALLPATGYLRQPQIIGKKPSKDNPGLPALVPVSASTLWQWVRDGKFPKPVKLGERITAWRVEDIRAYLEKVAA
ncbi:helix-turn-helix transcriptional regulator [Dyella acidiphila]|uniref:AlpA family phage regulatory protein n=1 Tax=Dyella acidiphila TaxID=2775866 RepID=A0ABR9G6H5_9GAMM|nr:AlpA family phage regulatory protein [Dyella acidiphila]MBE1159635.1 AlpA family phage regulatory protein [Dyella acidiphila]